MTLKVRFWGCTGSIPASLESAQLKEKLAQALWRARDKTFKDQQSVSEFIAQLPFPLRGTYKGNTNCIQILNSDNSIVLCDAGSGLRAFSENLNGQRKPAVYHLFLTHLHWDHIQGFPFFRPAFETGNKIIIHTLHESAEDALRNLMSSPYFPCDFDDLPAEVEFDIRAEGASFQVGSLKVKTLKQDHPDHSWAFRFEQNGQAVVISTDAQHPPAAASDKNYPFLNFFNEADILIFDAQFELNETRSQSKAWGHSDALTAVELASCAKVKQLVITHHDPANKDDEIHELLNATETHRNKLNVGSKIVDPYPRQILLAHDGLTIEP